MSVLAKATLPAALIVRSPIIGLSAQCTIALAEAITGSLRGSVGRCITDTLAIVALFGIRLERETAEWNQVQRCPAGDGAALRFAARRVDARVVIGISKIGIQGQAAAYLGKPGLPDKGVEVCAGIHIHSEIL